MAMPVLKLRHTPQLRIGVLASHPIVERALRDSLRSSKALRRLAAEVTPVSTSLPAECGQSYAVIIVDLTYVASDTDAIARKLRSTFSASKLVAVVSPKNDVVMFLQAGFSAVVPITVNFDNDLPCAISAVLSGSAWAPEPVMRDYAERVRGILESYSSVLS